MITKNIAKRSIGLLLILMSVNLVSVAQSDRHEFWATISVSKSVSDKWKVNMVANSQNRLDYGSYVNFLQAGLTYKINSHLYASGQYRVEVDKKSSGWVTENRYQAIVGYKWNLGKWKMRNRYRLEFRKFTNKELKYRHRTDLNIKVPVTLFNHFDPYINSELFVVDKEIVRTRNYFGVTVKSKKVVPSFYFLWQTDKRSWGHQNAYALGVKVDVKL